MTSAEVFQTLVPAEVLQTLVPAEVLRAYAGRPGCMCGCRGRYVTTPVARAEAEVDGSLDDADVSETEVTRVLRLVQAAWCEAGAEGLELDVGDEFQYFYAARGRRVHAVYLTMAARARRLAAASAAEEVSS